MVTLTQMQTQTEVWTKHQCLRFTYTTIFTQMHIHHYSLKPELNTNGDYTIDTTPLPLYLPLRVYYTTHHCNLMISLCMSPSVNRQLYWNTSPIAQHSLGWCLHHGSLTFTEKDRESIRRQLRLTLHSDHERTAASETHNKPPLVYDNSFLRQWLAALYFWRHFRL